VTEDDARAMEREIDSIQVAAPMVRGGMQVVAANANWATAVFGVTPGFLEARDWATATGRPLTQDDVDGATKVALLGHTVAQSLFGAADPIGQVVRVKRVPLKKLLAVDYPRHDRHHHRPGRRRAGRCRARRHRPNPPRLGFVDGQVSFWRPGAEEWVAAQLNTTLAPGDDLYTGSPGNLELQIGGGPKVLELSSGPRRCDRDRRRRGSRPAVAQMYGLTVR